MNSNSHIICIDEDLSLWIESSAIIHLHGALTKLKKYIVFIMQTYKKLIDFQEVFNKHMEQSQYNRLFIERIWCPRCASVKEVLASFLPI